MTKGRGVSKRLEHRESACPHADGTGQRRIPGGCYALGGLLTAFDQFEDRLKPRDHIAGFQQLLPLFDRDRQQWRDRIGQGPGSPMSGRCKRA